MKIYLDKYGALRLATFKGQANTYTHKLAGETLDIGVKIRITQDLRDACESFLEELSQEEMKNER